MPITELQPNAYLLVRIDGMDALRVDADGETYASGQTATTVFDAMETAGFAESVGASDYTAGTGDDEVSGTTKAEALGELAARGQTLAEGIGEAGNIGVFIRISGPENFLVAQSPAVGSHYEVNE